MNKPAPKEPSMDEILSSIRQIIADDDAAAAPKRPSPSVQPLVTSRPAPVIPPSTLPPAPSRVVAPAEEPVPAKPLAWDTAPDSDDDDIEAEAEDQPLALSAEQIVHDDDEDDDQGEVAAEVSFESIASDMDSPHEAMSGATLVYPDDVAFAPEANAELALASKPDPEPAPESQPERVLPPKFEPRAQSISRPGPPSVAPRKNPTAAQAASMPDPMLSTDIAAQLIEPATDAAVRHTFSRLNKLGFPPATANLSIGGQGITIEAMVRDMLRPMLKEWLDENLPAVVERMVEREIARISRGAV